MAGDVFVITAPSGTGKTTLLKQLMAVEPRLRFSISYTTRAPRPGEVHGRDYFFVSPRSSPASATRAPWPNGWSSSATPTAPPAPGWRRPWPQARDVVFDIEPRGAKALKQVFPHGTFIFILPPSWEQLERRLQVRGKMDEAEMAPPPGAGPPAKSGKPPGTISW